MKHLHEPPVDRYWLIPFLITSHLSWMSSDTSFGHGRRGEGFRWANLEIQEIAYSSSPI